MLFYLKWLMDVTEFGEPSLAYKAPFVQRNNGKKHINNYVDWVHFREKQKMAEENSLCHFNYFSSLFTSSHKISISIKERSLTNEPRSNAFSSTLRKRCSNLLFALRKASSALHLR